jgi:FkbM family methyltransferase
MYSQNDEEQYIVEFFGEFKGRFLDVGAYDGKLFSNTLRLVELGWSGVCVEPSLNVLPALRILHGSNPNIQIIESAIHTHDGTLEFYDSGGDAISSSCVEHKEKWERRHNCKFIKITVPCVTFDMLFKQVGAEFDFINIDVEATNILLLESLSLSCLSNLKLLCIEHDSRIDKVLAITQPFGFREIHRTGENLLVGR